MGRLLVLLRRLFGPARAARTTGRPPSANGASSFHVWWEVDEPLATVSAVLEVPDLPAVDRLYFFALQASFWTDRHRGGAHTGLQWNPRFPESRAVNWGGYDDHGSILSGTESPLPSTPADPNTRDFAWEAGRRYRLTIGPVRQDPDRGPMWPGSIEDLATGNRQVIRELACEGTSLRSPVVWAEVFADCDHPPVEVRWSNLEGTTLDGRSVSIGRGRVSYQSHSDGGCANTTVRADGGGIVQRTNAERVTPHGHTFTWVLP